MTFSVRPPRPARPGSLKADARIEGRGAGASLWWSERLPVPDQPGAHAGAIGEVESENAEAVGALLEAAAGHLAEHGCTHALGPLDGSTWHPYRVVTWSADGEPPFALEPNSRPAMADGFRQAGFSPIAHYHSTRLDALPDGGPRARERAERLKAQGLSIRPFRAEQAGAELDRLFTLAQGAFATNPFYRPIPRAVFRALYEPALALTAPDLVLLAERDETPVGFAFGLPDAAQAARGEPVDTLVVKTVGVDPALQGQGLGGALTDALHEAGRRLGLKRAIHALMHSGNRSVRITQRHGSRVIRRYALLARALR